MGRHMVLVALRWQVSDEPPQMSRRVRGKSTMDLASLDSLFWPRCEEHAISGEDILMHQFCHV